MAQIGTVHQVQLADGTLLDYLIEGEGLPVLLADGSTVYWIVFST
jgi:hypothetical protein